MSLKIQKRWFYIVDALVLSIALALVVLSIHSSTGNSKTADCEASGNEYDLTLANDAFSKDKLTIQKCDSVKITNSDTRNFRLAFGVHDRHVSYPGFGEQTLEPSKSITFTAVKAGTYLMHDHLRDQAAIQFVIKSE